MFESLTNVSWGNFLNNNLSFIILVGMALLLLLGAAFLKKDRDLLWILSGLAVLLACGLTWMAWLTNESTTILMWTNDRFALSFDLIFLILTGLTLLASRDALQRDDIAIGEYYPLLLLTLLGMMMMAHAGDLVLIFIGVETVSLAGYVLAGLKRNYVKSNEAAIKYLILGSFASAFLIYGIAFAYGVFGSTDLTSLETSGIPPLGAQSYFPLLAASFIMIGLGFKIAAVPFHVWTPDVYEGAPTVVSGFMASAIKAAAFAGLLRVLLAFVKIPSIPWVSVLSALAMATMTVGNLLALKQSNIKRMLAYSSIAHAGYALVGVAAAVAGNKINADSLASVIFYLLTYGLMTLGAFGTVIALGKRGDEPDEIGEWSGLAGRHPWLAASMALFMMALTGIPPTMGFMGKLYLFQGAMGQGLLALVIVGVLNSVVSAYYYLGVVRAMYFGKQDNEQVPYLPYPLIAFLFLIFLGLVYWGIFPEALFRVALQSASQVSL